MQSDTETENDDSELFVKQRYIWYTEEECAE